MTYLLDINVLIALLDEAHKDHEAAHQWFAAAGTSWATCPLTETGLVRIITNPAYRTLHVTVAEAIDRLSIVCAHQGHIFWPDDISIIKRELDFSRVYGHQ